MATTGSRECPTGKVALGNREAHKVARLAATRQDAEGEQRVYRCGFCGYYHTTHQLSRRGGSKPRAPERPLTVTVAMSMVDELRDD